MSNTRPKRQGEAHTKICISPTSPACQLIKVDAHNHFGVRTSLPPERQEERKMPRAEDHQSNRDNAVPPEDPPVVEEPAVQSGDEDEEEEAGRPESEQDDDLAHLLDRLQDLRIQHEPLRDIGQYEEDVVYRGAFAVTKNGRRFGVGSGYVVGRDGQGHYVSANGRRHNMSRRAPQRCFNCADRDDVEEDDKFHWRINCPLARGMKIS